MKKLVCLFTASLLHISMAFASTFHLAVEVTPSVAGTINNSGGDYEESSRVYLSTSKRTGYVFQGWYENDSLLTSSTSFYYTMPARDALVQARYEYNPSLPGDPSMPDTTTHYTLTTSISPEGAGSINHEQGQYAAGKQVYLSASKNTGFLFNAWKDEQDEIVSTSTSFYYTMPNRDVHLTAAYTYDPSTPANPDTVVPKYQVTVTAEPAYSGSFNTSSTSVEKGGSVHLYAYTNTGFVFKYWKNSKGDTLSTKQNFSYAVPEHDSQVIGVFEYNPTLPSNPNKNYWNPQTGEVIADEFSAGSLYSAISDAIKGSDRTEVSMITVAGQINSNDFGIANNFTNCSLFDFSRVTGVTTIPSYAFDGTNIETIYLPSTIETIGYRAFDGCSKLSSITCYATTPPIVENYVFRDIPEGLIVYVPSSVIPQYQEAQVWKDFTILPIQEDIRSITVCLPEGTSTTDYKQMWLELVNVKSGQRVHYIMTERSAYTFYNLIHHTTWNVQLRNEAGDVFGTINNVTVANNDTTVTFATLNKPQTVALSVLTPDGTDVTDQVVITWTNDKDVYIAKSSSLNKQKEGNILNYHIQLPQKLALQYTLPQATEYVVQANNNALQHTLQPLTATTITGKVVDAKTLQAIEEASVVASLTFANQYTQTIGAKTNRLGEYQLNIPKVSATLTFEAAEYISQTINCDSLVLASESGIQLEDVQLKTIAGAVLSLNFTYTTSVVERDTADTQDWYADYNNIQYTIYNTTQQRAITQFHVQYPKIVLLEEVAENDELLLTATSKNNSFMPVESRVVVTEQTAAPIFNISELGKIQATYSQSDNDQSVGLLYDTNGELIKTYTYNSHQLTTDNLSDATYTLVSMGYHQLLNAIYNINQLSQIGLVEGVDYIKHIVQVKSGEIATITIQTIPILDDSKLNYTTENTSFTVNKPSITAGNYLTLTGKIGFKPEFASEVSNVQLIVELPQSCSFVENSVMVGNATSNYVLQGNRLTIPVQRHTDRVRFCIIPTRGGQYAPSAYVQFEHNTETIVQPIGSANYEVQDLSIVVPSLTNKTTISVRGIAVARSKVEIFDNNTKIAETTALANGDWKVDCNLHEPYNLSTHSIHAKVTTPGGLDLQSETMKCMHDINAILVKTVTMSYRGSQVVFDFENSKTSASSYTFVSAGEFTFIADFTNNDTTLVSDVKIYVYTNSNKVVELPATYDAKTDKWVAVGTFDSKNLPINVSVDFFANTVVELDVLKMNEFKTTIEEIIQEIDNQTKQEIEYIEELEREISKNNPDFAKIDELVNIICSFDDYSDITLTQEQYDYINDINNYEKDPPIINVDEQLLNSISNIGSPANQPITFEAQEVNGRMTPKVVIIPNPSNSSCMLDNSWTILENYTNNDNITTLVNNNGDVVTIDFTGACNLPHDQSSTQTFQSYLSDIHEDIDGYFWGWYDKTVSGAEVGYKGALAMNNAMLRKLQQRGVVSDIAKWRSTLNWRKPVRNTLRDFNKAGKILGPLGIGLDAVGTFNSLWDTWNDYKDWDELKKAISMACSEDAAKKLNNQLDAYNGWLIEKNLWRSVYKGISTGLSVAGVVAAPETFGASLLLFSVGIGLGYYTDHFEKEYNKQNEKHWRDMRDKFYADPNCDPQKLPEKSPFPPFNPISPIIDPAGYVYEAVSSNRLQGVTATCYYKETVEDMYGDLHENIVKWNAEEYAQENPLFTDENGMYRWDVPQGLWQVKFEKEGYETTYSEWLPVPPPQLEVNIAMKQNVQPNVQSVHAYEDAIEIQFDKYMLPELLTTDNIIVMADSTIISGSIEMLDKELCYEGLTEEYVSKIRFNAVDTFATEEVTLLVKNRVKSYAGIRMQDDFLQAFLVEQELKSIACDSIINVIYGGQKTINVQALPAAAAAGKTLQVVSTSPLLLHADTTAVLDQNGQAAITLSGELPGSASIRLSIENTDITTTSMVKIINLVAASVIDSVICAGESITWCGNTYDSTGVYVDTLGTAIVTLNLTVLPQTITESHELLICPSELPYDWNGQLLTDTGNYTISEQFTAAPCDSVLHELTLKTYLQTLPASVTEPVIYTGQTIDVASATAEIQAYINAQPLYAPEAMIEWYIFNNPNWEPLTLDSVDTDIQQVLLKYAVETSCGTVESDTMCINTIMSNLESITHDGVDVKKIIHNGQVLILRNGNIYTTIGLQLQ